MRLVRRSVRKPPAEALAALALERGERVLTSAPTRGGSYVVATSQALHLPAAPREAGGDYLFVRLAWQEVLHASWRDGVLQVQEVGGDSGGGVGEGAGGGAGGGAEHRVGLAEPGSVPETVRERVTATVVADHRARLPGGGTVRIMGRRAAAGGRSGDQVRWSFVFEPGADAADPGLRAQAEQLLAELRRQTGL